MRGWGTGTTARIGAAAALALTAAGASAQEPMITDRPDFTESAFSVPAGAFQLEAGYTYTRFGPTEAHQIGEALLRVGVIPGLEARIGVPSYISASGEAPLPFDRSGINDASLGMKLELLSMEPGEGLPSVALLAGTSVPIGSDDFGSSGWEPEAKLALGWQITPALGLGANVGYAQRDPGEADDDRYDEWLASVALGFPLTDRLSGFGEYYAIRPDVGPGRDYVDGGVTYLVSDNIQLDARVGAGVDSPVDTDWFLGVGFSVRR